MFDEMIIKIANGIDYIVDGFWKTGELFVKCLEKIM